MQTQRDHVHAHQFMMGRLGSALVEGDPSSAEIPGRRALNGLVLSLLLVVLVVGGFAVYGWIVPGGSSAFRRPGVILVEKETGTRYVYLDGMLHPTPNLTSAMLIQGSSATVKLVSRASLADLPRGRVLGLAAAPESVPADALTAGPWLTCLPGSVVDHPGDDLGVNLDPGASVAPLPTNRFAVVRSLTGTLFLLALGERFAITDDAVLVALGASTARVVPAPKMWLDWIPAGPALAPAEIPGSGTTGAKIGGHVYPIGTLFRQQSDAGAEQFFVLRSDGLAPLDRTEFLFAKAKATDDPVRLQASALVGAPKSADRSLTRRLPDLSGLTWQDPGDLVLCLRQAPVSAQAVSSQLGYARRAQSGVDRAGRASAIVRPGTGMAVVPIPKIKGREPRVSFISDEGIAYPLADSDTASALKLNPAAAVPFPEKLLAAMRRGPMLSRPAVAGSAGG